MRRLMLRAFCCAFFGLFSIQVALAQQSETVGLTIRRSSYYVQVFGAGNGNWTGALNQSSPTAWASVVGSETNEYGAHGEYNIQGSTGTVNGEPGITVSGLNSSSSVISSISASSGGSASASVPGLLGGATAVVQTTTLTNPGRYFAEGTISCAGSNDPFTGASSYNVIRRNGVDMAAIWGSQGAGYGFSTQIVNGQEQQTWYYTLGGGGLAVEFFTAPGDEIETFNSLDLAGNVYSSGPGNVVTSMAWASTLEDIQVTFREF